MEARKVIESKREGEYLIVKHHCIDVKETIEIEGMIDRLNLYDEDGETAYFEYGICFNLDGEILFIDVNKFIKGISENLDDNRNEGYWLIEKEQHELFEKQLKELEKYKEYDIYL